MSNPSTDTSWGHKKANVTLKEIEDTIKKLLVLESLKQEKEAEFDIVQKQVTDQKKVVGELLKTINKKNYKIEGLGIVTRKQNFSIKVPKEKADIDAFIKYCEKKGMTMKDMDIGSKWLNAFVDEEFENAKEKGVKQFKIPG